MILETDAQAIAESANARFEQVINKFLKRWMRKHRAASLLRFEQPLELYLAGDALRDFFLNMPHPMHQLLRNRSIAKHLCRSVKNIYFDPRTGDPLLSASEQRIYNLARRLDSEKVQIPFRSVHPIKQNAFGDTAEVSSYPAASGEIRYNSGNHFSSRPANGNVFDEHSKRCLAKAGGRLNVLFERGFLEDRLKDVIAMTLAAREAGQVGHLFFVICSRHSPKEGHYGVNLLIMDIAMPFFPERVLVCDTLLKELPNHPRWWYHFLEEYANVFGMGIKDLIEDISHPLQKVNIKGDDPYLHDWDCPYYAASMTFALIQLAAEQPELVLHGESRAICNAMKNRMPEYYMRGGLIKERDEIRLANRIKRWKSGASLLRHIAHEAQKSNVEEIA